ncbi:MAG: 4-hydroxyphenylpyruvate dioxygenase [Candidatus Marinimicrobia bacterium]|nr:4-hydroxyphenylpyruvate dioxygenase [Candidatus Neomarinimicrobiota bacterium]
MSHQADIAEPKVASTVPQDPVPIKEIHHVELWVGNAKQAAYYYRKAFGFSQIAYSGLETGNRNFASYVLSQGKVTLLLSSPLQSDNDMTNHLASHGDGVRDVAFHVDDVNICFTATIERGAKSVMEPQDFKDDNGTIRRAAVHAYGDTIHSFISTNDYNGSFLPGYQDARIPSDECGLKIVDHVVANVELGNMNQLVEFYAKVMGFTQMLHFTDDDISTEYSALMSKVMQNGSGRIKLPINEPAEGKKKSQIEEYLDYYNGPGVQHVALMTGDIINTVSQLRENGVEFLKVPDSYYDMLEDRVGSIDESIDSIRKLGILVDRDDEGYLLQIFTKPVEDRPTLFYEIIQRRGSQGFGFGNFKALFEAIEQEQALRGNL